MLPSTPPELADQVAAQALRRRWAVAVRYLRLAYLVVPVVVVGASTMSLAAALPESTAWAVPLHVLLIGAAPVVAVPWLRARPWPPERWTMANVSVAVQFAVLVVEVAALLYAQLPVIAHAVVAGLSLVAILVTRACTWMAVFRVGHVLALGRAASDDPLSLSAERLRFHKGEAVLESDAIVWKQNHGRDGWLLPTGNLYTKVYFEPTVIGEIRFDAIRAVWPTELPPEELPYCWLVIPQQIAPLGPQMVHTKIPQTLMIQPTTPGSTPIRIPVPDADLAATLVRTRITWHNHR